MANKLFELFDGQTPNKKDLVSSSPKTLAQMTASGSADPLALQTKVDITNQVRPKVDYRDFTNFVFFNSALDYFNTSGERIINEWPYDGTYDQQLQFQSSSDGYQNYLKDAWPSWSGGITFESGTYIKANDVGWFSGSMVTSQLAPSGAGMTFEFHVNVPSLTASEFVVLSDIDVSGVTNYQLSIISGSVFYKYGANVGSIALPAVSGCWYLATVFDNASGTVRLYGKQPVVSNGWFDQFSPNPIMSFISGSSSMTSVSAFSGSNVLLVGSVSGTAGNRFGLSELRIWNKSHSDEQLFANYNARVYQQDNLQLYWRFGEGPSGSIVKDYSGHKLSGTIFPGSGTSAIWRSYFIDPENQQMSPQTTTELSLDLSNASVVSFISSTQASASLYDKFNSNIITNLVPFMYLYLEDERETEVLKNLLYLLARQFDEIKVGIDQIPKLLLPSYTGFNETPNALLADTLKFWGFDTKANFLSEDAFKYFFGYDVLVATEGNTYQAAVNDNQKLDITLDAIKSEFWHRTLQELIYIYKKKGTKEAVSALLRVYGLDDKIVKLKEFGMKPDVRIQTNRIQSDKSTWVKDFSAFPISAAVSSSASVIANSGSTAVNLSIRFPLTNTYLEWNVSDTYTKNYYVNHGSYSWKASRAVPAGFTPDFTSSYWDRIDMRPTLLTGTIFELSDATAHVERLTYLKNSITDTSGVFQYVGTTFTPPTGVFDGRWHSLMLQRIPGAVTMSLYHLDEDVVDWGYAQSATLPTTFVGALKIQVGNGILSGNGEFSALNLQVWNLTQSLTEQTDHTLNPFSFGATTPERAQRLEINWMFDKDANDVALEEFDQSVHHRHGQPYDGVYHRELMDYNFIAPVDYGWSEEKIRYSPDVRPPPDQNWLDSNIVSLEMNLVDALNEDVSLMLATMDNWNNTIGAAANRHRENYPSLERFRAQYFQRLHNRINFRAFADFMDFFDRSFVELVHKLLPARANFKGAEFVVESHMLERPKVQYTYRRQSPQLVPEGVILIYGYPPLNIVWLMIEGHYP